MSFDSELSNAIKLIEGARNGSPRAKAFIKDTIVHAAKGNPLAKKTAATLVKATHAAKAAVTAPVKAVAHDIGKTLGLDEAQRFAQQELRKLGLPNLPFQLPSHLTASAIADAAYGTAKGYIDKELQAATGLPLKLPKKLSVKELGHTITSLIPHDAREAMELALSYATQATAQAVTSLLIGAGIGSAIPGLGTIVGIGAALGVSAIRNALKTVKPSDVVCHTTARSQSGCSENLMFALDPVEMLPWIARSQEQVTRALATEQARSYCGRGDLVDCAIRLEMLVGDVGAFVSSTVPVLGLPQLERLIPLYAQAAQSAIYHYDPVSHAVVKEVPMRGYTSPYSAASYIAQGRPAYTNALGVKRAGVESPLAAMLARRDALRALVATAQGVNALPPSALSGLRWSLVTELKNAAVQLQNNQDPETSGWINTLAQLFGKYDARQKADHEALVKHSKATKKRAVQTLKDPKRTAAFVLEQLNFQCSDGNAQACEQRTRLKQGKLSADEQLAILRKAFGANPPPAIAALLH